MRGTVDNGGRSLLTVVLTLGNSSTTADVEAWIDTGFTGELVMPQRVIASLGLTKSGSVDAVLASRREGATRRSRLRTRTTRSQAHCPDRDEPRRRRERNPP